MTRATAIGRRWRHGWRLRDVLNGLAVAVLVTVAPGQGVPAQAARIAYVQSASAAGASNGTSLALAFPAATAAGNLIVATVSFDTGPGTVWNCSDTQGNTYTKAVFQNDGRHAQGMGVCFAPNIKGGANTVTATLGASTCCRRITIHEYSGAAATLPLDRTASATGAGTTVTSPTLTPTLNGELIFAAIDKDSTATPTATAGSGYTLRQAAARSATEDRVQTTAAATTATFALAGSTDFILAAATFKPRTGETTPPSVSLTGPAAGSLLTGTAVGVSATATDNVAVAGVQFLLDGQNLGAEDTAAPYSVSWNTTAAGDGGHLLSARARDTSGNQATAASVPIVVDNTPPSGTIAVNGGAAATNTATATLTLSAADPTSAVTAMRFSNTGTSFSPPEPYATTRTWTLAGAPGVQTVSVQFMNAAGLWSPAFTDTIVLTTTAPDTEPPGAPAGLTSTAASSSSIVLSWPPATDNVGVAGYDVQRNGIPIATVAAAGYTDTGLAPNTTYTYAVAAFDAAANLSPFSAPSSATTQPGPYAPAYPLKVSANNRYLVDQNNVPFMIVGNDAQALIGRTSDAEADLFLADRRARGFNALWVDLLCYRCVGDGTTIDGIPPFTTAGDISTPNEAYFARVDKRLQQAAANGLAVFLNPAETIGSMTLLRTNGVAKDRAYGQYLGARYRSFDNIVWLSGNDLQTWSNPADDAVVQAVALGIKDADARHLHTVELNFFTSGSLDDPTWQPIIGLDAAYTYFATYDQVLKEYNRPNFMPVFMVEANYEGEQNVGELGTPYVLRLQEYWTMLSGAAGQLYGNHFIWQFSTGWQTALNTPGALQFGTYLRRLFDARPWYTLVPDQNHTVVTAGFGTYITSNPFGGNNYVTAGRTPDGALVMAYLPKIQTVTVDMARMASPALATWFDPTSGTYTPIAGSPFANAGSRQFSPPGTNHDGDTDWVLVLEATAPDTTPPAPPAGLTATAVSTTRVNLFWSPSADNVAVSGYRVFRDGALVATTTVPGYADTALTAQTTYTYTVTAFDFAGNVSEASSAATVTTPAPDVTPPGVPANVQPTTVLSTSIALAWTASADNVAVAGYRVYRDGALAGSTAQASFTDTGLTAATTYSYAVEAYDFSANVSARSLEIAVTTLSGPLPIAAYGFDEAAGTTTADASGNGLTGTLTNGPLRAAGHNGNGLSFDGVNDYVNLGNPAALQLTGSMTITAWVLETANPADDGQIIAKSDDLRGWQFKSSPDTGARTFAISISDPATTVHVQRYSRTVRALNTWYHVAGVYNAATRTLDIYVNGVLDNGVLRGGAVPAAQANNSSAGVTIGQRAGGWNIKGVLDNVRVYGAALTAAQIQADMIRPLP